MSRIYDALKKPEEEKAELPLAQGPGEKQVILGGPEAQGREPFTPLAESGTPRAGQVLGFSYNPSDLRKMLLERSRQPEWNPDRKTMLLFDGRTHGAGVEEFRTLRSRLDLMRGDRLTQKLLVTSSLHEEGKTLVAANLALAIARQRERNILLIDGDLRKSRLHQVLGTPLEPGLVEYLEGSHDVLSIVQRCGVDNMFFVPGGRPVPNPNELIANGRLKLLLEGLAPAFDAIILDSPPVVPVADAKLMAGMCDGVILVVQAGSTPYDLAQRACREFGEGQCLGVVLNRAESDSIFRVTYYHGDERADSRNNNSKR